jgi:hypothetical protein
VAFLSRFRESARAEIMRSSPFVYNARDARFVTDLLTATKAQTCVSTSDHSRVLILTESHSLH